MISNAGKTHIKRYMAGHVPAIAQAIAFGLGSKSEDVDDTALQFEISRVNIVLTSYDFIADKVVFKAVLPDDLAAKIYEVAIFSQFENPIAGNFGSKVLASFDSDSETWADSSSGLPVTYSTAAARIGGDSLSHTPAASGTVASVLNDVLYDLSGNSGADKISLAYNVGNANAASVAIRFRTDASNYYSFTVAAPAAGYRVDTFLKGNAVVTGSPSWADITAIEVVTVAKSTGAASVDFDGIRIEDTDTLNPEYVMVARELLALPYIKEEGKLQEIEFSLNVSV